MARAMATCCVALLVIFLLMASAEPFEVPFVEVAVRQDPGCPPLPVKVTYKSNCSPQLWQTTVPKPEMAPPGESKLFSMASRTNGAMVDASMRERIQGMTSSNNGRQRTPASVASSSYQQQQTSNHNLPFNCIPADDQTQGRMAISSAPAVPVPVALHSNSYDKDSRWKVIDVEGVEEYQPRRANNDFGTKKPTDRGDFQTWQTGNADGRTNAAAPDGSRQASWAQSYVNINSQAPALAEHPAIVPEDVPSDCIPVIQSGQGQIPPSYPPISSPQIIDSIVPPLVHMAMADIHEKRGPNDDGTITGKELVTWGETMKAAGLVVMQRANQQEAIKDRQLLLGEEPPEREAKNCGIADADFNAWLPQTSDEEATRDYMMNTALAQMQVPAQTEPFPHQAAGPSSRPMVSCTDPAAFSSIKERQAAAKEVSSRMMIDPSASRRTNQNEQHGALWRSAWLAGTGANQAEKLLNKEQQKSNLEPQDRGDFLQGGTSGASRKAVSKKVRTPRHQQQQPSTMSNNNQAKTSQTASRFSSTRRAKRSPFPSAAKCFTNKEDNAATATDNSKGKQEKPRPVPQTARISRSTINAARLFDMTPVEIKLKRPYLYSNPRKVQDENRWKSIAVAMGG